MHGPAVKIKCVASEPISLVASQPFNIHERMRVYKFSFRAVLMSQCCFQIYCLSVSESSLCTGPPHLKLPTANS